MISFMDEITVTWQFLLAIEMLGLIGWPVTRLVFAKLPDQGWGFTKIIGVLLVGWVMWMLSSLQVLPFNLDSLLLVTTIVAIINWVFVFRLAQPFTKRTFFFVLIEEILFIGTFSIWTYLRGFAPDLNGLEKFMDYGFMLSILRTEYFPPLDHFLAGETINYYYFGHYLAAMITRLAQVSAAIGYNLQMSVIFGLTMMQGFTLGAGLFFLSLKKELSRLPWRSWLSGLLTAIFVGLIGNLHALFYQYILEDASSYWYPDATRFIENTIHEFPIYSFIVNDLHGHVSSIPMVLLILGLLGIYFVQKSQFSTLNSQFSILLPLSFTIGSTYATNAWDFAIYLLLSGIVIWVVQALRLNRPGSFFNALFEWSSLLSTSVTSLALLGLSILWFLPYWLTVSPISQGIGIVPWNSNSPLWQLAILWGVHLPLAMFFVAWIFRDWLRKNLHIAGFVVGIGKLMGVEVRVKGNRSNSTNNSDDLDNSLAITVGNTKCNRIHFFLLLLCLVAVLLIILPEFIFVRDIYPTHFRANTMFKLFYQAWIMLGLVAGYSIVWLSGYFNRRPGFYGFVYRVGAVSLLFAGLLYPTRAIEQGLNGFQNHRGTVNGTTYLNERLPDDAAAIGWLNQNIVNQPVVAEAVGESYTDYARIASNTGLPTVLGWPVHEWLWRGSYGESIRPRTRIESATGETDSVAKRVEDVQFLYETHDLELTRNLIAKYDIEYIYVGQLERDKYPELYADKFDQLELEVVYDKNGVIVYRTQNLEP